MYKCTKSKGTARFSFKPANGQRKVLLAGDFTQWKPIPMVQQKDGSFAAEVPLSAGTYQYKFIVDGKWTEDPENRAKAANAFGTVNSVAQM